MKLPADLDALCKDATEVWGVAAQEAVAIGEIGELLTLWGKRQQKRATEPQWIDEIADCIIMLHQLARIHGCGTGMEAVERRIAEKVPKLRERVEAWQASASVREMQSRDAGAGDDAAAVKSLTIDAICGSHHAMPFDVLVDAVKLGFMTRETAHDGSGDPVFEWDRNGLEKMNVFELRRIYANIKTKWQEKPRKGKKA